MSILTHGGNEDVLRALKELVDQLEVVHNSKEYEAVWSLNMIHGVEYKGPNYAREFETAKKVLADVEAGKYNRYEEVK